MILLFGALNDSGIAYLAQRLMEAKARFLLDDPARCETEFVRTRECLARERNWDATTDQFEELYEAVLSPSGPQPRPA